jgi:hypothetical protein
MYCENHFGECFMLSSAHQSSLSTRTYTAAADTNGTAVALTEQSAAFVSFQRQPPSFPPISNVHSAVSPRRAAVQFSGNDAIYAANAVTTTTFAPF